MPSISPVKFIAIAMVALSPLYNINSTQAFEPAPEPDWCAASITISSIDSFRSVPLLLVECTEQFARYEPSDLLPDPDVYICRASPEDCIRERPETKPTPTDEPDETKPNSRSGN